MTKLSGYKEIAKRLSEIWGTDVSERTAYRAAHDASDPLPVKIVRRCVLADPIELESWARRQVYSMSN